MMLSEKASTMKGSKMIITVIINMTKCQRTELEGPRGREQGRCQGVGAGVGPFLAVGAASVASSDVERVRFALILLNFPTERYDAALASALTVKSG